VCLGEAFGGNFIFPLLAYFSWQVVFDPHRKSRQKLTLMTEGILRKLQNVMKLTQKWKDFENNGTT
jgi:hypothetical protein